LAKAYYSKGPQHSYSGLLERRRQALMEAQRFPEDYDGILAETGQLLYASAGQSASGRAATTLDPASYIPSSKLPAIAGAVNAACDAQDGVTDGILNDPRQCHFDPETMLCKEGDSEKCLTAAQVATLKKLYEGRTMRKDEDFSGLFAGSGRGPEDGKRGSLDRRQAKVCCSPSAADISPTLFMGKRTGTTRRRCQSSDESG